MLTIDEDDDIDDDDNDDDDGNGDDDVSDDDFVTRRCRPMWRPYLMALAGGAVSTSRLSGQS